MYHSGLGFIHALGFFAFLFLAVGIGIVVLYILTLRRALTQCAPQNRAASPDSAWLLLIPIFHIIWAFILYPQISESLEREFRQRGIPIEPQPARSLGLALAILQACCLIPIVNIFAGIANLVCFILYWIKISGYANQLAASPAVYYPQPPQPQWAPQPASQVPPQWPAQPPVAPASFQPGAAPLPQALHCTACGVALKPGDRFCANCGKLVV